MATAAAQGSLFRRPTATTGWWSWVTTVDHKKIGIMYCATALAFFVIGGLEALAIPTQLAVPNGTTLTAETYNQFFTMHGLTMSSRRGLVRLRAAEYSASGQRHDVLLIGSSDSWCCIPARGGQLHRDDPEYESPGNDADAHAGVHLDDPRNRVPASLRDAGHRS